MSHGILRAEGFDRTRFLAAILAAVFLAAGTASAQITTLEEVPVIEEEEIETPWLLYGISGFGTLGTYAMEDLNSAVDLVNAEIADQGSFGVQYDNFNAGPSLGGGLRAIVRDRWLVCVDYERLFKTNNVGGVTSESQIRAPADAWTATLGYDLLRQDNVRFGFAVGLGRYTSAAEQVITETLAGQDEEEVELGRITMDGDTIGQHYQVFFETRFTEHVFVSLQMGYRAARITDLEIAGLDDIQEPSSDQGFISVPIAEDVDGALQLRGGGQELDWSGFVGKVAFTYYINVPELY